ncbi:MAG: hypothetical protein KDA89_19865 [Planctomycetaceae bacterium]|nr:hypothetical protein [Planctomycetaceae bacterium]
MKARRCLGGCILLSVFAAGLVFPFDLKGPLWAEVFDLAHTPAFFFALLFTVGLMDPPAIGLPARFKPLVPLSWTRIPGIAAVLLLIGGAGELIQPFVGRSAGWGDFLANSIGLSAGLIWIAGCRLSGRSRKLMCGLAAGAVFLNCVPTVRQIASLIQQYREFPVLASFEDPLQRRSWLTHKSRLTFSDEWASAGKYSGQVTLFRGQYPMCSLDWFPSDWSNHTNFKIDFFNPSDAEIRLVLKICDRRHLTTSMEYSDRFHRDIILPPKEQFSLSVPIDEIRSAPADRELDLTQIAVLEIFSIDAAHPIVFHMDNLRLAK